MAIITNRLRQLAVDGFVDILTNQTDSQNAYFFFGKSKPWSDALSIKGVGVIKTNFANPVLLDITDGVFSGIAVGDTIKNLDNGEVRQVIEDPAPTLTQVALSASPGITWNTANWAFKKADSGLVWVDDNNPPAPTDCVRNIGECEMNMLALKKIDQVNIEENGSCVVPRFDWDEAQETVYAPYTDDDGELLNHPTEADVLAATAWNTDHPTEAYTPGSYFVLVSSGSNLHVFKCLDNGGPQNKSTVRPDKTLCTVENNFTTPVGADGYIWKFMYSLSAKQIIKYLTDSWVPIRYAIDPDEHPEFGDQNAEQWLVQTTTKNGTIDRYTIIKADDDVICYGDGVAGTQLPVQSGVTNEIKLDATDLNASDQNDAYNGCDVFVFSADVDIDRQIRTIIDYDGATRVATVSPAFDKAPTVADKCCIAPKVTIIGYQDSITAETAVARAVIPFPSKKINYIQVLMDKTNKLLTGSEYKTAAAKVTVLTNGIEVEVAQIKPELSPLLGHGGEAISELGGYFLMLNVRIKNEEGLPNNDTTFDFMRINDYRVVGIVRNIKKGNTYPTADTLRTVKVLLTGDLKNGTGFAGDEIIEYRDSGQNVLAKGYVIEFMQVVDDEELPVPNDTLTFFQDLTTGFGDFTPVIGGRLYGITSGEESTIGSVIDNEADPFTGEILYIEQRKPVIRAEQQLEDVKIVIEF